MKLKPTICLLLICATIQLLSGQTSQTVFGKVVDKDSRLLLIGATVQLIGPDTLGGNH